MRTENINGHKIEFYDSIEQLPIVRFHAYSKYMLVAAGIGDNITDIDSHMAQIIEYVKHDTNKAIKEIMNLRQALYVVATKQDIRHKGFLNLVYSVDRKVWEDFSESGLDALYKLINGATEAEVRKMEAEIIHAIDDGLATYFPKMFDSSEDKNMAEIMRKITLLKLDEIINGDSRGDEINALEKELVNYKMPKNFEGENKEDVEFDKRFEDMCLVISREFNSNAKKFTTMEFYSAYENLQKQSEELKKIRRK